MNFYQRLLNAGITKETPYDLIVILRTAAITNLCLIFGAGLFLIVFLAVAPGMVPVVAVGVVLMITSLTLQYFGFHLVSRLVLSVCVCAIAAVVYGHVTYQVKIPMEKTFAVAALFALAPWYLFSVRELAYSVICMLLNLLILLFINDVMGLFRVDSDVTSIGGAGVQNLILIAGVVILSGSTLSLQWMNRSEARKGAALLEKLSAENSRSIEKERALNDAIDRLTISQQEEQRRAWATRGLAEVSRILRSQDDAQKVSDQIIAYLVKYVEANQGAVFQLMNDTDDQYFELKSCYAYERKKFIDKKIDIGQGLLGQCFFEKGYIHITEVPANYIHITSGLGLATPRALLMIPVMVNDDVTGAMEFASFRKFEPHQIEFLVDVGEIMATHFSNQRVTEQTKKLLAETQLMAEQMRSQDEEMRQNMEEIAATQEHQWRMENELREQLAEKERTIAELNLRLARREANETTLVE